MRPSLRAGLVVALVLAGALLTRFWVSDGRARGAPIRIAFAGPLSGPGGEDGLSQAQGIELVFAERNRAGGVAGRPLVLERFDDGNEPERALARAREIAARDDVAAVIGHTFSSCALAAGPVYAETGIPVVTAAATSVPVTRDNPWSFRVVYNDRDQGRLVALYVGRILEQRRVGIAHETQAYGSFLARVMQEAAPQAGIGSVRTFAFDAGAADLGDQLDEIARELGAPGAPRTLLLAMQPEAAVQLVKRLRDAHYDGTLVATDSLASQGFIDGFDAFPAERAQPGFYSDGIYVSTPFLFDVAGSRAEAFLRSYSERTGKSPDWYAAFGADAGTTIAEALRRGGISPAAATMTADRAALRDALAAIGPDDPVVGVTGPTWFDAVGDAQKPVPMGRIQRGETVSAYDQLRILPGAAYPEDLDPRYDRARVLRMGDQLLYRTDVARVGVRSERIEAIDFDAGTFLFDFHLWFRQRGDRGAEDVVFTNAVEPIALGKPVDELAEGDELYRLYHVKGTFRADTLDVPYGRHALAISLHPRERTRDELVLAIDSLGMNVGRRTGRQTRARPVERLLDDGTWAADRLILFESAVDEHALGHPRFLGSDGTFRRYSDLTLGVTLKKATPGLRGLVPSRVQEPLLVLALAGSAVLVFARRSFRGGSLPRLAHWALQSALALLLLMVAEPLVGNAVSADAGSHQRAEVARVFDVLWWVVPAFLLNLAVRHFVWEPAEERSGRTIPTLLRWSVASVIALLAFFGVVAFVYDYTLTGLLATSGVLAMIIGLAVQLNITNLFAGVALNLERPFRVGDWIMVHGRTPDTENGVIGQVVDINWRTTRLRTADDTEIVIPNGAISEKTITNFMAPGEMSRFELVFRVDQEYPPEQVLEVIQGALDAITGPGRVVAKPAPKVKIRGTTDSGIEYLVRYRLIPREVSPASGRHLVNASVLAALRRAGMELAYPRRRVREEPRPGAAPSAPVERPAPELREVGTRATGEDH